MGGLGLMYRFIGVIKGRKNVAPYDLLITHKDFKDKEEALERLEIYNNINISKAVFTVIDSPVELNDFLRSTFKIIDKKNYSNESLIKLEKVLKMEKLEERVSNNIEALLSNRKPTLDLFESVYEKFEKPPELGSLIFDNVSDGVILGEAKLKIDI